MTRTVNNISGILLLDKPTNITSNKILQKIKTLFRASKAGHCGTLDPFASGVLAIAVGKATKTVNFVMDGVKKYEFTIENRQIQQHKPKKEHTNNKNTAKKER